MVSALFACSFVSTRGYALAAKWKKLKDWVKE